MTTSTKADGSHAQYVNIAGQRMVVMAESEYERLRRDADSWEPPLPPTDANGNYPADEAMAVSIARGVLRDRRRLGLSQEELARRAGIRVQTLDRIERAQGKQTVANIDRIDRALKAAERQAKKAMQRKQRP